MRYEYKCECGVVEVDQSIKDDALDECPECGNKEGFERIVTGGAGFVLDSSGWARSGYDSEVADY